MDASTKWKEYRHKPHLIFLSGDISCEVCPARACISATIVLSLSFDFSTLVRFWMIPVESKQLSSTMFVVVVAFFVGISMFLSHPCPTVFNQYFFS